MSHRKRPKARSSHFTRGGQITFHNLRMLLQVNKALFVWTFWGGLILTVLLSVWAIDDQTWQGAKYHMLFYLHSLISSPEKMMTIHWDGVAYQNTLGTFRTHPFLAESFEQFLLIVQWRFVIAISMGLALMIPLMRYFHGKGEEQTRDYFIRGMQEESPKALVKQLRLSGEQSDLRFDGLKLFKKDFEVQHVLADGTTGAGKSVAIRKMLRWIRDRGDKAIVYDKGCTFVSKFYNPATDVLLNPFDERCAYWDVWCDGKEATDFEAMASALIPMHGEGDPFWVQSARTIFTSTAFKMVSQSERSTERLLKLMLTSSLESLSEFLEGTESATLVSEKIQKTAISIKSVLAAYIKSLRFLSGLQAGSTSTDANHPSRASGKTTTRRRFSIRQWVQDDSQKGFLFLSSHAQQHASLRPLLSMWLSIASTAILGLEENPNRRIWVIMDEAPSLHKLPELTETIAEVRKFGGCYLIGIQSFAQLRKVYGDNAAKELFDLLNTRLFFRSPSYEMAKLSSQDLGEQEIDVSREQYSYGANTIRDGISLGHQTITRPVVTPSQIMLLNDLQCYLRTPGDYPVVKLDLTFDPMTSVQPPFIKRTLAPTQTTDQLDRLLTWCQIGALSALDEDDRRALLNLHQQSFNNDQARAQEEARMKASMQVKKKASVKRSSATQPLTPDHDQAAASHDTRKKSHTPDEQLLNALMQAETSIDGMEP